PKRVEGLTPGVKPEPTAAIQPRGIVTGPPSTTIPHEHDPSSRTQASKSMNAISGTNTSEPQWGEGAQPRVKTLSEAKASSPGHRPPRGLPPPLNQPIDRITSGAVDNQKGENQ